MNGFNPGDGWRDVTSADLPAGVPQIVEYDENGIVVRCWIAEEPVPPLPTEPYTVIRVTGWKHRRKGVGVIFVNTEPAWVCGPNAYMPIDLAESITGFEVLAEPLARNEEPMHEFLARVRQETAKAVLDRVAELIDGMTEVEGLRREFGVSS